MNFNKGPTDKVSLRVQCGQGSSKPYAALITSSPTDGLHQLSVLSAKVIFTCWIFIEHATVFTTNQPHKFKFHNPRDAFHMTCLPLRTSETFSALPKPFLTLLNVVPASSFVRKLHEIETQTSYQGQTVLLHSESVSYWPSAQNLFDLLLYKFFFLPTCLSTQFKVYNIAEKEIISRNNL